MDSQQNSQRCGHPGCMHHVANARHGRPQAGGVLLCSRHAKQGMADVKGKMCGHLHLCVERGQPRLAANLTCWILAGRRRSYQVDGVRQQRRQARRQPARRVCSLGTSNRHSMDICDFVSGTYSTVVGHARHQPAWAWPCLAFFIVTDTHNTQLSMLRDYYNRCVRYEQPSLGESARARHPSHSDGSKQ